MKALGSLLILAGFGAAWAGELSRWRCETETLVQLIAVLEALSDRIRLTRMPLPRLLRELSRGRSNPVGPWLAGVAEALERGELLRSAWDAACRRLPVEDGVKRTVGDLGYKLSGDETEICKGIDLVTNWLRENLKERRREKRNWTRQATAVCFSGAALLIILLL